MAQSRATVLEKKVRKRSEGGKRKWHFPLAAAVPNEAGGGSDREKRSPTPLPSSPGSAIAGCVALLPHPRRPVFKSPPPAGRRIAAAAARARHRGTTFKVLAMSRCAPQHRHGADIYASHYRRPACAAAACVFGCLSSPLQVRCSALQRSPCHRVTAGPMRRAMPGSLPLGRSSLSEASRSPTEGRRGLVSYRRSRIAYINITSPT